MMRHHIHRFVRKQVSLKGLALTVGHEREGETEKAAGKGSHGFLPPCPAYSSSFQRKMLSRADTTLRVVTVAGTANSDYV